MQTIRLLCAGLSILPAVAAPGARSVPLVFVENHGQTRAEARFLARTPRFNVYFERREAVLELRGAALRIGFLDATGPRELASEARTGGEANFLIGPEEEWVVGAPLLEGVAYRDIYPGIDAVYRGSGPNLKSEYVVRPGSDPARIRLRYAGADRLEVLPDGSLSIRVGRHVLRESAPVLYQDRGGVRSTVEGGFAVNGDVVSFIVGGYDRTLPLTIDPLLYLTLFGGSGADAAMSLAVDSAGSAYIAGFTASFDLPAASAEQRFNAGGNEAFVAKLSPAGNGLVYCTYIGGRGDDRAYGIAVDSAGAAYVAGSTTSSNFPVRGAIQAKLSGGRNAFVLKLSPAGNTLAYSTYLGGNAADTAYGIAVDGSGNAYVAGDTTSAAFPATAFQRNNRGAPDGFVAKLAADGSRLLYSTYLGGSSEDHVTAIAVDASGSAVVAGSTYSPDFPVANAYQPALAGGQDAFVAKLAADGNSLVFSTYLGGSNGFLGAAETAHGIAVDASGNVYVAGETSSTNFPVKSAAQTANAGWQDGFVSKFGPGGGLVYSTCLGGVNVDIANAVAVDRNGYAYIAGETTSANLASLLLSQNAPTGVFDAFVVKLAPAGDTVAALAYLGGIGADNATSVAVDGGGNVYVAGWTQSPNFGTVNGFQTINGGNYSAFVGKLSFTGGAVSVAVSPATASLYGSQTQQFTATVSNASNTAVTWSITPAVGTVSATGLYTAPASVSAQQTITVKATSVADATKSATAAVTLLQPVAVTVAPTAASLAAGESQQFVATGATGAINWSVSPNVGTVTNSGLYTAPDAISSLLNVTITATSAAYPSQSASAIVTLVPAVTSGDGVGGQPLRFVPIRPCRVADTRNPAGSYGGPALGAATRRDFNLPNSACGVPAAAQAYLINVTAVPLGPLGFVSLWPAGQPQPAVSTLNSPDGRVRANAAIVPAGSGGSVTVLASNPTHIIVDVTGYFVPAAGNNDLAFYPIRPCRLADTRNAAGGSGGPALIAGAIRSFPVFSGPCGIPGGAQAYALNVTVFPDAPVGFLSIWPAGDPQPGSSTLNAPTGAITSNAAVIGAGTGGVSVIASNPTHVAIDITGYFAAPGAGSLDFYALTPCRIVDTRGSAGPFGGPLLAAVQPRVFLAPATECHIPASAQAYSLNVTLVPPSAVGGLTVWGSGPIPGMPTFSSVDGNVVADAAFVMAGRNGAITAFSTSATHVVLDINGYFR